MSRLRATVRLQFHKDFTLDAAVPLVVETGIGENWRDAK